MPVDVRNGRAVHPSARYALCALSVVAATWLGLMIVGTPARLLTLTPFGVSVAFSVWLGGFRTGVLALLLSAAALDFFIIDPGSVLRFSSPHALLVWSAFTVLWLAFCVVAEGVHRRAHQNRVALQVAEDEAAHADRVGQLTAALAHARTPAAVIEAAVQEPLHALRADAALLLLVSRGGQKADVARAVGYGEDRDARIAAAIAKPSPAWDAVGRGAPVTLCSNDDGDAERVDRPFSDANEVCAIAAVPLLIGSAVVAVVQLEFNRPRLLTPHDRDYLASLAVRGAEALDRTWQYEAALRERAEAEALRARANEELAERQEIELALRASEARYRTLAARTSRLHSLAAALSGAVTVDAVARAVVEHGCRVLGATNGDLFLLVENGTQFQTLYSDAHPFEWGSRFDAEPGLCATDAVKTRLPVFIGSFAEWQQRYAQSASIAADGGYASSATLPLQVDSAIVGVLAFYFTVPVNFDDEYQALLVSVAQRCAQALDRARLYEAAQRARADAETANRLKDDFMSIVSHELRTPLNSMLGWIAMLRRGSLDAAATERALQSVHDNATRQAKLVEDLLDLSSITAGRVTMDMVAVDLRTLLRGAVETMIPAAAGSGLTLELSPVPALTIQGDPRRLEQIFLNVLGNAVKFTPEGGRIGIEVRILDKEAEVRVSDSGPGIDPEFLPHMFDRFSQAKGGRPPRDGGVGLGLSIAKELVEAHRGRIRAESEGPGHGSTFVVTLPIVASASLAGSSAAVHSGGHG